MSIESARAVNILLQYRWIWATCWLGLVVIASIFAPRLEMDRGVDRLLDPRDEEIRSYQTLSRVFGALEPIVVAYHDADALEESSDGIECIRQLEQHMGAYSGVAETICLADLDQLVQETLGHSVRRPSFLSDKILQVLEGFTHSADGQTVSVLALVDKTADRSQIIQGTRQWLAERAEEYPNASMVGEPVMVEEGIRLLERDGLRLNWNASILMALVLLLCFRSLRWMIIAAAVVQSSLAMTRLILVASGAELSLVSTMFSSVVTVIAVAATMHWIVRFREAQLDQPSRYEAVESSMSLLLKPLVWACLTDAAGFAALLVANVGPVRDFGWIMIVGSLCVMGSLLFLVPCLILIPLPRWLRFLDADSRPAWNERLIDRQLETPLSITRFAPTRWLVLIGGICLLVTSGIGFATVETDFTKNFKSSSVVVRDYRYFEENLGGAGVWDVLISFDRPLDWEAIKRVRAFEERLLDEVKIETEAGPESGITHTLSVPDAIVAVFPVDLAKLPFVSESMARQGMDLLVQQGMQQLQGRMPSWLGTMYAQDPEGDGRWFVRVLLRSNQQQSAQQSQAIIEQVKRMAAEDFPESLPDNPPEVTGWFVLLTRLVGYMMSDQWLTFTVAATAIFLMMWLATLELRLAVVAMVPNLLPIGVVLGTLGWLGVPINMGVALIAAVSIGLSIDNTLHYLAEVQRTVRQGASTTEAIHAAQHRAGAASVFSTLALV